MLGVASDRRWRSTERRLSEDLAKSATPPATDKRPDIPPPLQTGVSVIGGDLSITGQDLKIVSKGQLRVDASITGELHGVELVLTDKARVEGTIVGEQVTVHGHVAGIIRGREVTLRAGAYVEGDIHHDTLVIERGAAFEGRAIRPAAPPQVITSSQPAEPPLPATGPRPLIDMRAKPPGA